MTLLPEEMRPMYPGLYPLWPIIRVFWSS